MLMSRQDRQLPEPHLNTHSSHTVQAHEYTFTIPLQCQCIHKIESQRVACQPGCMLCVDAHTRENNIGGMRKIIKIMQRKHARHDCRRMTMKPQQQRTTHTHAIITQLRSTRSVKACPFVSQPFPSSPPNLFAAPFPSPKRAARAPSFSFPAPFPRLSSRQSAVRILSCAGMQWPAASLAPCCAVLRLLVTPARSGSLTPLRDRLVVQSRMSGMKSRRQRVVSAAVQSGVKYGPRECVRVCACVCARVCICACLMCCSGG
jgi:hypothetical protein